MKAQSASLTLYHFEPGHHTEVCMWHDQDHKPEVVGTMPNVFISQRWVAPPELMAARRGVLDRSVRQALRWPPSDPLAGPS
jgi:hypothetical protein